MIKYSTSKRMNKRIAKLGLATSVTAKDNYPASGRGGMRISKATALYLLSQGNEDIVCFEYGADSCERGEEDFWSGVTKEDLESLVGDEYINFEIWPSDQYLKYIKQLTKDNGR